MEAQPLILRFYLVARFIIPPSALLSVLILLSAGQLDRILPIDNSYHFCSLLIAMSLDCLKS